MKTTSKYLATFFTLLSMLSASLLWITRDTPLSSQSQFFDEPNGIWYRLLLIGITMTFFVMNASNKNSIYGLVSYTAISTLMFDVLEFRWLHNISAGLLFVISSICLTLYTTYRKLTWWMIGTSTTAFILGIVGVFGPNGLFLAEFIAEILLSIGLLLIIWKKD